MWFRSLFASTDEPSRRRADRRIADRRLAARRLLLEPLEDRVVLTFAAPTIYPVGSAYSLAAADFTGDGILDLATQGGVLVGNGDGSFQPRLSAVSIGLAGDVDGDGKADLIATDVDKLYVAISNGDGTFQPAQPDTLPLATPPGYDEPLPQSIESAVVGDLNADGLLDLVVTGRTIHEVSSGPYGEYGGAINRFANVLMGTGLGTFDASTHYLGFGGGTYFFDRTEFSPPDLGDFNGDGNLDLLMSQVSVYWSGGGLNSYSALSVWLGNGDGTLQPARVTSTYPGPHFFQLPADFNQDGRTDVLIDGEGYGTHAAALARADGAFTLLAPFPIGQHGQIVGEEIGDVNGDGNLDLVIVNRPPLGQGTWADVFLGNGNGTFTAPLSYVLSSSTYSSPTLADFNGDGFADLATVDRNGGVIVHLNTGGSSPTAPGLRIADASVTEGNTGTTSMTFTVTLTHAATGPVTVQYATANGTAASGSDYQAASGTITFTPGQTSQSITVQVSGDRLAEDTEAFYVNLTSPTNAVVTDPQGVGTLLDDEPRVSIDSDLVYVTEGNTGTTNANLTVRLSAPYDLPVRVNLSVVEGDTDYWVGDSYWGFYVYPPATLNTDFEGGSQTITFHPGELTKEITVPVIGDREGEADEYFFVNLDSTDYGTIVSPQAVGIIDDDEPLATINSVAALEGAGTITFTISLSNPSPDIVEVTYATADGGSAYRSATAGSDYVAQVGTVTFHPGELSKTITVQIIDDRLGENDDEYFFVNLTSATGAVLDYNRTGTGYIQDNEPRIFINNVSLTEGNSGTKLMTFTVTLSAAYDQPVTVNYATQDGSAVAGSDYVATAGMLTFAPGQTSKTITVAIKGDKTKENDEYFYLLLSNASDNARIYHSFGSGTILNDEGGKVSKR